MVHVWPGLHSGLGAPLVPAERVQGMPPRGMLVAVASVVRRMIIRVRACMVAVCGGIEDDLW